MKGNIKHPSFIIAVISLVVLTVGVIVKGNRHRAGDYKIGEHYTRRTALDMEYCRCCKK